MYHKFSCFVQKFFNDIDFLFKKNQAAKIKKKKQIRNYFKFNKLYLCNFQALIIC